jgi:hypothetical protein
VATHGGTFVPDPSWPTIVELATELWGQPTERRRDEVRWGTNGSKRVTPSKNVWKDEKSGEAGGYIKLWDKARPGERLPPRTDRLGKQAKSGNGHDTRHPLSTDIGTTYDYPGTAADPRLIQVVRTKSGKPRRFLQRQPLGNDQWQYTVSDIPDHDRRLYLLAELHAAPLGERVWICAGEKDTDRLFNAGLTATTNIGGEGKWRTEYAEEFSGRHCVVLQDNDATGEKHVAAVANSLHGIAASVRVLLLPGLPPKGDVSDFLDAGHTLSELDQLADAAPVYVPQYNGGIWDAGDDDYTTIPPRGWLLGTTFCRQFMSSLLADGGVGKTAVRLAQLISLASGRPLTGEHVFQRCRVLILSLEDGRNELRRRVYALMRHYRITPADLKGWLFLGAPKGVRLAELKDGVPEVGPLKAYLEDAIRTYRLDIISLDPFVKTHSLPENSNDAIDWVCTLAAEMAIEHDIAFDSPHHTNKGVNATPGDSNRGRGATAHKDAGRLVDTLTPMSPDEAEEFSVPEKERRSLIRMDNAKVNIAPPATEAKWFRLVSVPLGNPTPQYPQGDHVQVVERWPPPQTWAGLDHPLLNTILDEIDAGLENGQRYSSSPAAKDRAAWRVVQAHAPGKTDKQCRAVIIAWLKSGTLFNQDYDDPVANKSRSGLSVNATKRPS